MQRRTFWLVLLVGFYTMDSVTQVNCKHCWGDCANFTKGSVAKTECCMKKYSKGITKWNIFKETEILESILEETEVNQTTNISVPCLVALLQKPPSDSRSIEIYANSTQATSDVEVSNRSVRVQLPAELHAGLNSNIVFCMIQMSDNISLPGLPNLSGNRLVGVSVGRNVTGLKQRINITMSMASTINETREPKCVFLNMKSGNVSTEGCEMVEHNQTYVTCSCDHLTYFGVLLVSADVSPKDAEILSYITYIGCGISLFALVITVGLFITNRKLRADDSKKIHISLAVALILLNVHFLSSQAVAASSSTELCVYVALLLHYSLLASFTWMALEGFHLYLLLVKVFNVYMRRYLLKLSVVGWGLPAVFVSLVVIINKDIYGRTSVDSFNGTEVCYITNTNVKMVTTVGVVAFVFFFNVIMLGVVIKWFMGPYIHNQRVQSERNGAKNKICTLLVLMVLLGLTWGLIFFSLGQVNTPVLYIFCIVNCLQGFFIFFYFALTLVKNTKDSAAMPTTDTPSHCPKT
ncbi:adhesion G-protein coupled receptor G2-like [Poeciliopsis prolifica]|uniref:adhesion G-protein coupled receptor G2-like n=1 Tax=Poeciliopsis prolifica TaxID=188132 RepID=UPI002413D110|nr:adhesion G-protein coupled receptor G2-like [Poeciliopsis prolifica]